MFIKKYTSGLIESKRLSKKLLLLTVYSSFRYYIFSGILDLRIKSSPRLKEDSTHSMGFMVAMVIIGTIRYLLMVIGVLIYIRTRKILVRLVFSLYNSLFLVLILKK